MKNSLTIFLLFVVASSFFSGTMSSGPIKSKAYGTYKGILPAYTLIVEGDKVEVMEGAIELEISEETIIAKIANSDVSQTYKYQLVTKSKTGTLLSLSTETVITGGELFLYKKGDKADLTATIFGGQIQVSKQK
jgi:hypothetical protein